MTRPLDARAARRHLRPRVYGWIIAVAAGVWLACPGVNAAGADLVHGVVVDQTGLPLPGALVEVHGGAAIVASSTPAADGSFTIPAPPAGATVVVSLAGFAAVTSAASDQMRVVLPLAATAEQVDVKAALPLASSSP
ncbi:MAG: carboxypeptidase-like regulatory domain-containing protein, partial [Solirubrobacteraceae bacterium]